MAEDGNGNHPGMRAVQVRRRAPGSGPILILAGLFLAATFLAWYFTWFGRELSDADISKYLADTSNPRHVQHALLQIQQRIERGDATSKTWYPQLIALSGSPETEFRLTVAWLMGFDNNSTQFHEALLKLLKDSQPIVRRNAALALVRFNDASGREELVAILKPYAVKANASGTIASSLQEGATVARTTLLARIGQTDGKIVELRSPLPGRIDKLLKANGTQVTEGGEVLTLYSDENSVWEALRGLSLVGSAEDLPAIESYANSTSVSAKIREQAALARKAIQTQIRTN
jgi:HEAT repeats